MKKLKILIFLISYSLYSQINNDTLEYNKIEILKSNYKEFEVIDRDVYALSKGDTLVKFNLKNNKFKLISNSVASITKTNNKRLIYITNSGQIYKQKSKSKFICYDTINSNNIYKILIDNKDKIVIHCSDAVYYDSKPYIPDSESPFYRKAGWSKKRDYLIPTNFIFIDKQQTVWFAYNGGEWGGDVCLFDLNSKQFLYDINLENSRFNYLSKYDYDIKSFCYDNEDNLLLSLTNAPSTYLNNNGHSYYVHGEIIKFSKTDNLTFKSIIYNNNEDANNKQQNNWIDLMGPLVFNKFNNKLFFFTSIGFFELNSLNERKLFFKPKLKCSRLSSENECFSIDVVKFDFISKKEIIFLTSNNGIGYYNGLKVIYFQ